jgi:hypothetical protein
MKSSDRFVSKERADGTHEDASVKVPEYSNLKSTLKGL